MTYSWSHSRIWFITAILTYLLVLVLKHVFSSDPTFTEQYYTNGIYPWIRWFLNHSFGLVPFSSIYLVGPLVLGLIVHLVRSKKRFKLVNSLEWTIGTVFFIIVAFYLLWGFNYSRTSISKLLDLDKVIPDSAYLLSEIEKTEFELIYYEKDALMLPFLSGKNPGQIIDLKVPIERELRSFLEKYQKSMPGPVPLRMIYPRGLLMGFGASGVYFPLSGEANVDPGLPLELQPFVIAHELCHAYGITDEGSCNFIAYLICQSINDPIVNYSGKLQYFRYLLGNLRRNFPENFNSTWNGLDPLIRERLRIIRTKLDAYPEFIPKLRPLIYDQYLKNQGIEEGIASYSKIIELWAAYQEKFLESGSLDIHESNPN